MRRACNKIKIVVAIVFAACVGMGLSSCVWDDLSGCVTTPTTPAQPTLKIDFVALQETRPPITSADLKKAVVYLFDSQGSVFATWVKDNPELTVSYDTGITLGADTYRLVAWVNPDEPFTLTPPYAAPATRSVLDDARLTLNVPAQGVVSGSLPNLYYGSVEQLVTQKTTAVIDIPLVLDSYRIKVTLDGINLDGSTYALRITDDNGAYDFNNRYVATPGFTYEATATATPTTPGQTTGDLPLSINMLRLSAGRSPQLSLVNTTTGEVIYPKNSSQPTSLVELITRTMPNPDFNEVHQFDILLDFGQAVGIATVPGNDFDVIVNGWLLREDNYNVNPY